MTEKAGQKLMEVLKKNHLNRLKVGDNRLCASGVRAMARGLVTNTSLTQLHLGGNKMGDPGLIALVSALTNNRSLTSLGLRDNNIGPDGMEALAHFLADPHCPFLELQVKGNRIADLGACHLAMAIETNTSLRVLEVQSNCIGAKGCVALCRSLVHNKSIYAINMNDNQVCDGGAAALGALLQENDTITTIGISKNHIAANGAIALASALLVNRSLTGLDLGTNQIGDNGVTAVASALSQSVSLVSIDLHSNELHFEGMVALTEALAENRFLRHVDVGSNYSRNPGAFAWARLMEQNSIITRLCLTDNEIGHIGGEALRQAMVKNTTLRNFCFGGQSTQHPVANHISSATRRAINAAINRNKALYSEQLRLLDTEGEGLLQQSRAMEKHLVNSYRNRPLTDRLPSSSSFPLQETDSFETEALVNVPLTNDAASCRARPACTDFPPTGNVGLPLRTPSEDTLPADSEDDVSYFVGAWPAKAPAAKPESATMGDAHVSAVYSLSPPAAGWNVPCGAQTASAGHFGGWPSSFPVSGSLCWEPDRPERSLWGADTFTFGHCNQGSIWANACAAGDLNKSSTTA
eukprot:GGOE01025330.1.p1 GENE.GGOE01025330.1~~GGOE01025330.1.p1  ORF type:complete len:681 (+),score=131.48 GGOE01025330.1:307-2043(+)